MSESTKEPRVGPQTDDLAPWKSMSFGCGGWLQFYLYGVARAIQAYGLDYPDVKYLGCSAGALAATGIVLDTDFDVCIQYCKDECLPVAHGSFSGLFQLHIFCSNVLDIHVLNKYCPLQDDRLQIAITQLPSLAAERATKYSTCQELKDCLMASCAAFPLSRLKYRNGIWCVDGGLTDFQPVLDDSTITVSPFYFSNCDIKPSRYVPLWWAVVPPKCEDSVDWLYHLGFEDALAYFERNGLKPTSRAKPEYMKFNKNPHPFDIPGRVSLHRVLGYHVSKLTQGYLAYVIDFLLYLFLLFVVKPLMLFLIYADLLVQMVWHFMTTAVVELYEVLPLVVLSTFMYYPNSLMTYRMTGIVFLQKLLILGPSQYNRLKDGWLCVRHMFSLSLIKGFWTLPKRFSLENAKEESLAKLSVLYRVFKHAL